MLMYMRSRWRRADLRLRISGVIQGEGEGEKSGWFWSEAEHNNQLVSGGLKIKIKNISESVGRVAPHGWGQLSIFLPFGYATFPNVSILLYSIIIYNFVVLQTSYRLYLSSNTASHNYNSTDTSCKTSCNLTAALTDVSGITYTVRVTAISGITESANSGGSVSATTG